VKNVVSFFGILLSAVPEARGKASRLRRLRLDHLPRLRHASRTHRRTRNRLIVALAAALLTASCNSTQPRQLAIANGYVGPYSLNLRKDLGPKAPTVATIKHGDPVEVLETRRRFVKLRTAQGVEGWTDENLILSEKQMANLRMLVESAKRFPSQGVASVYDSLNMHVDANRNSPSFYQITEGVSLDVIGHRVARVSTAPEAASSGLVVSNRLPGGSSRKKAKSAKPFELGAPPAPAPPPNWQELSKPRPLESGSPAPAAAASAKTGDDWSLVRTREGKVGWVLTRMLVMNLPEEVAQYGKGKRIMGYLPLGQARDRSGSIRKSWVFVTQSAVLRPNEFDTLRVYVWNAVRGRYESALNERNLVGYYPLETLDDGPSEPGEFKRFSIVEEDKDGKLYKRIYGFKGLHARMESREPYTPPADLPNYRLPGAFEAPPVTQIADVSWQGKLKGWWSRVRGSK
jgi:SH3-like domain-containing protein